MSGLVRNPEDQFSRDEAQIQVDSRTREVVVNLQSPCCMTCHLKIPICCTDKVPKKWLHSDVTEKWSTSNSKLRYKQTCLYNKIYVY